MTIHLLPLFNQREPNNCLDLETIFLLGLAAASIVVPLSNFQTQAASAKDGDSNATAVSEKEWYQNADEIATFLSSANPNWSKDDLRNMLNEHLVLTKAEAVARLTGNYTGDIATFDQIHKHANGMSDAIVAGIVKQFPEKFSTTVSTPSTTTVPSTK